MVSTAPPTSSSRYPRANYSQPYIIIFFILRHTEDMHDSMSDMRFWDCCVLGEGEIGVKMSQAMISRPLYIEELF
jgi:hypothetical protein